MSAAPGRQGGPEPDGPAGAPGDGPGNQEDSAPVRKERHLTPSQRRTTQPRRIYLPWWGLTLICAGVGFALAEWLGAVVAGVLGYFAWRLR